MSNHNFATVPKAEIQRSSFDRSHNWKGTFDEGELVPFFVDEVLPGDTFNLNVSMLCRMATPIVPIMDNLYLDTFFFFVPNRLIWDNWQKFMGERIDPDDSIDYLIPFVVGGSTTFTVGAGSVMDYMGIPLGAHYGKDKCNFSALPFRAYCLIWNEWFRDENLQDSIKIRKDDTPGYTSDISSLPGNGFTVAGSCLPRNKRFDYFSACLPWPQKGDSIDIPLGTSAPVFGTGKSLGLTDGTKEFGLVNATPSEGVYANPVLKEGAYNVNLGTSVTGSNYYDGSVGKAIGVTTDAAESGLIADLSNATAATINTLRQAFQVQRMLERDARGGTRYTEILRSHFNVVSPDARLQRPEYLGGSSTPFVINPVQQTSSTDTTTPQGNLAAFGVCGHRGHGFTKSFVEHGIIIGLCCVRGDLNYQQGLNRMWSRRTRYDFYWPTLAHLGEQSVLNKEIYVQGTSVDEEVFGFQERYAEYRYFPNMITGKFRSTYSSPLDIWHLAQKFDSLPTLSSDFIKEKPPISRVVAVPSEPHFLMDCWFKLNCVRPMPLYGTPGLIDHF